VKGSPAAFFPEGDGDSALGLQSQFRAELHQDTLGLGEDNWQSWVKVSRATPSKPS
jgi:hypothetical protein